MFLKIMVWLMLIQQITTTANKVKEADDAQLAIISLIIGIVFIYAAILVCNKLGV